MKDDEIEAYINHVQRAIANAELKVGGLSLPHLLVEVEAIVQALDQRLREDGLVYPTPNETLATARTVLWVAWLSWLWTAKAERDQRGEPIDVAAQQARPYVEALIQQAIRAGQTVGRAGGVPRG